jgi:hypothetical protein
MNHGEVYPSEKKHEALYCMCVCDLVGLASPKRSEKQFEQESAGN